MSSLDIIQPIYLAWGLFLFSPSVGNEATFASANSSSTGLIFAWAESTGPCSMGPFFVQAPMSIKVTPPTYLPEWHRKYIMSLVWLLKFSSELMQRTRTGRTEPMVLFCSGSVQPLGITILVLGSGHGHGKRTKVWTHSNQTFWGLGGHWTSNNLYLMLTKVINAGPNDVCFPNTTIIDATTSFPPNLPSYRAQMVMDVSWALGNFFWSSFLCSQLTIVFICFF